MKVVLVSILAILGFSAFCYGVYLIYGANPLGGSVSIFVAIILGISSFMSGVNNMANIVSRMFSKADSTSRQPDIVNTSTNQSGGISVAKIDTLNINAPFAVSTSSAEGKGVEQTKDYLIARKSLQYIDSKVLKCFSEGFESCFTLVDQNAIRPIRDFVEEFSRVEYRFESNEFERLKISLLGKMRKFLLAIDINMGVSPSNTHFLQVNVKLNQGWSENYAKLLDEQMTNILAPKKEMEIVWAEYLKLLAEKFPPLFFE